MDRKELKELQLRSYKRSQEDIDMYFNLSEDYDHDFVRVIKELLKTNRNPYSYLEPPFAEWKTCSEYCASFLRNLHHAMVDDGDVCFTSTINHSPYLLFMDKWDMRDMANHDCKKTYKDLTNYNRYKPDVEYHNDVDRFIKDLRDSEEI